MRAIVFGLLLLGGLGLPARGDAHPLGNFSISQYTGLRIRPDGVELRYVIDLAEIPRSRRSRTPASSRSRTTRACGRGCRARWRR
jgi:hypothetical protein